MKMPLFRTPNASELPILFRCIVQVFGHRAGASVIAEDRCNLTDASWGGWKERWTDFGRRDPSGLFSKLDQEGTKGIEGVRLVGVAPLCFDTINSYVKSAVYKREINITKEDFARIKEVRCAVRFREK